MLPEAWIHRCVGEAADVQHDLPHADLGVVDLAAALGTPAGNDVNDALVEVKLALVEQLPDADAHDRLGRGEHAKKGVVVRVLDGRPLMGNTEHAERGEFALVADRELGGRHVAVIDDLLHIAVQVAEAILIESGVTVDHGVTFSLRCA